MNIDQLTPTETNLLTNLVAAKFAKWTSCGSYDKYRYLICAPSLDAQLKKRVLVVCNAAPPKNPNSNKAVSRYQLKDHLEKEINKRYNLPGLQYDLLYVRGTAESRRRSVVNLLDKATTNDKKMFLETVNSQVPRNVASLYAREVRSQAIKLDEDSSTQGQAQKYKDALLFNESEKAHIASVAFSVIIKDLRALLGERFDIPNDMYIKLERPYVSYSSPKPEPCQDNMINIMTRDKSSDEFGSELYAELSKYDLTSILDQLAISKESCCLRFAAIYGSSTHQALCLCGTDQDARVAAELAHSGSIEKATALIKEALLVKPSK